MLTVNHHNKAGFFAVQELFNHDTVPCVTKGVACQHVMDSRFRFFQGHRNDNAFTGSQTVGFDNNRGAFLTQIGQCRFHFREVLVFRCRNVVTRKEVFGERF